MEFSRGVDGRQKLLVQLAGAEQPEADQADLDVVHQPEPGVSLHLGLELPGQPAVVPHVLLQAGHPEVPDDKPELQGAESSAERNAPVLQ